MTVSMLYALASRGFILRCSAFSSCYGTERTQKGKPLHSVFTRVAQTDPLNKIKTQTVAVFTSLAQTDPLNKIKTQTVAVFTSVAQTNPLSEFKTETRRQEKEAAHLKNRQQH